MIIIISCDKKVIMFFSKYFMDSYGMEHLPKMNHTMHSPKKLKINNSNEEGFDMEILQLDEVLA